MEICSSEGYVRILGKLAELKDSGIDIYFFVGNHDLWMKDYLEEEIGIPVFFEKQYYEILERICKVFHLKFESLAILML